MKNFAINNLDEPNKERPIIRIKKAFLKFSSQLETLIILVLWLLAFTQDISWTGLNREELITYLLIGNIIGLMTGYLLYRLINEDLRHEDPELLLYNPLKFLGRIVHKSLIKNFLPFLIAISFQLLLLSYLVGLNILHTEINILIIVLLMVTLAFITELLLAYLLNLFVFWTIESPDLYRIFLRFKKALAGNYFPLTILPVWFTSLSLLFPFAYSFYIPTQLYLKQIPLSQGITGLFIQLVWIALLFAAIKLIWIRKKIKSKNKI